jgi:hypothetical protein
MIKKDALLMLPLVKTFDSVYTWPPEACCCCCRIIIIRPGAATLRLAQV